MTIMMARSLCGRLKNIQPRNGRTPRNGEEDAVFFRGVRVFCGNSPPGTETGRYRPLRRSRGRRPHNPQQLFRGEVDAGAIPVAVDLIIEGGFVGGVEERGAEVEDGYAFLAYCRDQLVVTR